MKSFNDVSPHGHYAIKETKNRKGEKRFTVKLHGSNGEMLSTAKQPFNNVRIARDNIIAQIKANRGKKALVWNRKTNEVFWLFSDGGRAWLQPDEIICPKHK
jgi:hypothetical protein